MKITLITPAEHTQLLDIFNNFPSLTLQNKGYEGLNKDKFTPEEKTKFDEVTSLLKKTIVGFSSFQNFRHNKDQEIQLRFQYDWTAHDRSLGIPFTGVGYILLDELLNGFRD